jgi:hypothetical protein
MAGQPTGASPRVGQPPRLILDDNGVIHDLQTRQGDHQDELNAFKNQYAGEMAALQKALRQSNDEAKAHHSQLERHSSLLRDIGKCSNISLYTINVSVFMFCLVDSQITSTERMNALATRQRDDKEQYDRAIAASLSETQMVAADLHQMGTRGTRHITFTPPQLFSFSTTDHSKFQLSTINGGASSNPRRIEVTINTRCDLPLSLIYPLPNYG